MHHVGYLPGISAGCTDNKTLKIVCISWTIKVFDNASYLRYSSVTMRKVNSVLKVTDMLVAGFKVSGVQLRNLSLLNCFIRNKHGSKISGMVSEKVLSMRQALPLISRVKLQLFTHVPPISV
jgi:hypothetical protein